MDIKSLYETNQESKINRVRTFPHPLCDITMYKNEEKNNQNHFEEE